MGVPKFFRWISVRYPCINQILRPGEVPVVDHLYLDMNGILHSCSHPEGTNEFMTEETIFQNIGLYIQFIFELMKPRKTFFMAVDGVAPRSKMTQQRARRFQSALEARDAVANGKGPATGEKRFDPCLISPGTEFMERLHIFLKTFVDYHVNNDVSWSCINVIYSGHDCPGEGEHKIREYMSYCRGLPDYQPNERHCIYGMDADLIFLGLTTHEVNLCILRENIVKSQTVSAENKPFCITHLSVLREYIALEFKELNGSLRFAFDLERLIDDWIFMAFLLGNDFIPHIPNLHIHAESLLILWDTYKVVLPQLDGYLVEYGYLNIKRFHRYLQELSQFERDWFEEREADLRWVRGKQGARLARDLEQLGNSPLEKSGRVNCQTYNMSSATAVPSPPKKNILPKTDELASLTKLTSLFSPNFDTNSAHEDILDEAAELLEVGLITNEDISQFFVENDNAESDDDVDDNETELESDDLLTYKMHKRDYYYTKLNISVDTDQDKLLALVRDYVKMLQWILNYYFLSVADWDFVYTYHYAPFACDLLLFTKTFVVYGDDMENWPAFSTDSEPVLPFVQQLMILPADSAYMVPAAYRDLMSSSSSSPLAEFFPDNFETDLNGKLASWEAVVLIPFMDMERLLKAMASRDQALTQSERLRNQHKSQYFYCACPPGHAKPSAQLVPHDFYRSHMTCATDQLKKLYDSSSKLVVSDYPSLMNLPFTFSIQKIPVHVFEYPSKFASLALEVGTHPKLSRYSSLGELAKFILGRPIRVRWPHCSTVMPVRVMNMVEIWELTNFNIDPILCTEDALPAKLIRNRQIIATGRSNLGNDNDKPQKTDVCEQSWVSQRIMELQRHYRVRRAILFGQFGHKNDRLSECSQPGTQNDESLTSAVLIISRPLDGWSVVHQNGTSRFTHSSFNLIPNFTTSRAQNGFELELGTNSGMSSWFDHSSRLKSISGPLKKNHSGKKTKSNTSTEEKPSMIIEPDYGRCDDLVCDLLDLVVPGTPPAPAIGLKQFDWNFSKTFSLDSVFHSGQIVISLGDKSYGRVGEVVRMSEKKCKVYVRFYPAFSPALDLSEFRFQVTQWETNVYQTSGAIAYQLGVPVSVINRLTGTLLVSLPKNKQALSIAENTDDPNEDPPDSAAVSTTNYDNKRNQNKPVHHVLFNIGLNLRLNRSKLQVLGWSKFCHARQLWIFSPRTIQTLLRYQKKFPELWRMVLNNHNTYLAEHLPAGWGSKELNEVLDFIQNSGCKTAPLVPQNGTFLDQIWVEKLCTTLTYPTNAKGLPNDNTGKHKTLFPQPIESFDRNGWNKLHPMSCDPETLFVSVNANTRIYPSKYLLSPKDRCFQSVSPSSVFSSFKLLDRIVFIGIGQNIPLGLMGTVTGMNTSISTVNDDEPIEILFDRIFPGAIDTRGSGSHVAMVRPSLLLRLPDTIDVTLSSNSCNSIKDHKFSINKPAWATEGQLKYSKPWPTLNPDEPADDVEPVKQQDMDNQVPNSLMNKSTELLEPSVFSTNEISDNKKEMQDLNSLFLIRTKLDTSSKFQSSSPRDEILYLTKSWEDLHIRDDNNESQLQLTGSMDKADLPSSSSLSHEYSASSLNLPSSHNLPLPPTSWSSNPNLSRSNIELNVIPTSLSITSIQKTQNPRSNGTSYKKRFDSNGNSLRAGFHNRSQRPPLFNYRPNVRGKPHFYNSPIAVATTSSHSSLNKIGIGKNLHQMAPSSHQFFQRFTQHRRSAGQSFPINSINSLPNVRNPHDMVYNSLVPIHQIPVMPYNPLPGYQYFVPQNCAIPTQYSQPIPSSFISTMPYGPYVPQQSSFAYDPITGLTNCAHPFFNDRSSTGQVCGESNNVQLSQFYPLKYNQPVCPQRVATNPKYASGSPSSFRLKTTRNPVQYNRPQNHNTSNYSVNKSVPFVPPQVAKFRRSTEH